MGDVTDFVDDMVGSDSLIGRGFNAFSDANRMLNPMDPRQYLSSEGGMSRLGDMAGIHTATTTDRNNSRDQATRDSEAATQAAIRQAEYEKQAAMGRERTRIRRRRGFASTVLGGGKTTLGSGGLAESGKTLLGE